MCQGVTYLPYTSPVLNIFEPRYRAMFNDILFSGARRFMVCNVDQETGRLAEVGVVFYLDELKEVSEQTQVRASLAGGPPAATSGWACVAVGRVSSPLRARAAGLAPGGEAPLSQRVTRVPRELLCACVDVLVRPCALRRGRFGRIASSTWGSTASSGG